jgi:hypothetical protein
LYEGWGTAHLVGKSLQGWVKDTGPLKSVACGRITVWLSTNNEIGERHLLRYLLLKHPLLVKSVLIIVGMTIIGSFRRAVHRSSFRVAGNCDHAAWHPVHRVLVGQAARMSHIHRAQAATAAHNVARADHGQNLDSGTAASL